jgi:hypothetical protein
VNPPELSNFHCAKMPDTSQTYHDPLELFRAAAACLHASDWLGAARLCDPVSLSAFKIMTIERCEPERDRRELTLDDMRYGQPDMPIEVAEYNLAQYRKVRDRESPLDSLAEIDSVEALATTDPQTVFAAHLHGTSPREQMRRAWEAGLLPRENGPIPWEQFASDAWPLEPMGFVDDGSGFAHILYRHVAPPADDVTRGVTSRRERAMLREQEQREAALPDDVKAFRRERAQAPHPMLIPCRRQPDGNWLMLADYQFLSSNGNYGFGFSLVTHDDSDDDVSPET